MEVSHLRAVFPLCALVFFTLLAPVCALGALPTTVETQVDWLADRYAEDLELYSPSGLSAQSIATSRAEVAGGLRSIITQPLTRQQLRELNQWLASDKFLPSDVTPADLRLHAWAASGLEAIRLYLSRPPVTPEQRLPIRAQTGIVFNALRKELAAQFSGAIAEPEAKATGAVFSQTFLVSAAAISPVSPKMKRLFTPTEMDMLAQYARDAAVRARTDWDEAMARVSEEERAAYAASLEERFVYLVGAAAQLQYKILGTSYTPPEVLTKEEWQAVIDAEAAERAAAGGPQTGGQ